MAMSRGRRTTIVVLLLVVLPLAVLGSAAVWFWWQVGACGGGGETQEVEIQRGWGVPDIADELHDRGMIGNALVFNVYARLNGDSKFDAGTYKLQSDMCVKDAVKLLNAGPVQKFSEITIPPGLWMKEIAQRVAKLPGLDAEKFVEASKNNAVRSSFEPEGVASLEGLLRPDTYKIAAEEDEIQVLKTLVDTFDERAAALGLGFANVNGLGAYDIIKVASLIESEAKTPGDRPLIASVIYNRLKQDMQLQIDASLIYARGDPKNRSLSNADKQINSPYNTYANKGLPPTPIAAVSDASIEAALHPAETDYLYYVVIDKQGNHAFATTLEEHEQNIQKAQAAGVL
jgi:UPF0755 protein